MDMFIPFAISGSALKAQKMRLDTVASNLANVETTSTPEGGPYKKKSVYFETQPLSFKETLDNSVSERAQGVTVKKILSDETEPKKVYNPSHPDADEGGYVAMPNVNVLAEMVDMMSATRSYQANVTVIKSAKRMALKALEIGG
ncbi:MAG: flagellar basal body rod protein FlgC [Desulfobulbaceae bacterium]|jgi:flagellar basal-body rod protein FlgC|nr:flagellar basal body rod protein FlgC [Desulfobulbaceae bacterium]